MQIAPGLRRHYLIVLVLSIVTLGMAVPLAVYEPSIFERVLGKFEPLPLIAIFVVIGAAALLVLNRQGAFRLVARPGTGPGIIKSVVLATLFAVAVVIADLAWRFPEDVNIAFPQSLLFYPVIGYTAEMAFHATPLAMLMLLSALVARRPIRGGVTWFLIIPVALLEPAFQLGLEASPLSAAGKYTAVHVLAINLCQLYLFKRHDFVSMLSFRLAYYFWWHIVWGSVRLQLLFEAGSG